MPRRSRTLVEHSSELEQALAEAQASKLAELEKDKQKRTT